ncbi:beta-galactosidase [Streptomyces sp. TS71-3]|uniref:beta-galactosidase n=1 Tax=Streptomyces sp. TS71-3 TaxID=2733862 RepID=UPI001BB398CB|nr:beta-galactosidase [Streptomyces sp. TS71-3]
MSEVHGEGGEGQETGSAPWYRRVRRWAQTNLTEADPERYDAAWWRQHWRRTRIGGVIVNAGGIVAYYPSEYPLQHRALTLGERDLYGEIAAAAHEDGLAVLARMDSNRTSEEFYAAHPDWFAVDRDGAPYRAADRYITCVNSPYYHEYLPGVLREIIERSQPEGITDNSWSGLDRGHICYCAHCAESFRADTGRALPAAVDWDDRAYREWVAWGYRTRLAVWDLNNRVTREAGGPHCLWLGMTAGRVSDQAGRFRDMREICRRSDIVMLDSQARPAGETFSANADAGALIHEQAGWGALIPESTAMYGHARPTFRLASKPVPEVRLWAEAGFAGGIQPWWHHIGAYHDDRRQYRTAEPLFTWHEANERYLVDREPVAAAGVVWSQRSTDYFGRDDPAARTDLPFTGVTRALRDARIGYLPVHADDIAGQAGRLGLLILPEVGAMSAEQCEAVRAYAAAGGSVIATGETSRYDEWGEARGDLALADLLGVHTTGEHRGGASSAPESWETGRAHSYLRLHPAMRAAVYGPRTGDEPPADGVRHPVLDGFDETDLIGFAGRLEVVRADADTTVPVTFVAPFPIYPPETSWIREPDSGLPAVVLRELPGGGRSAYLAADLDRCTARDNQPDHARLLGNLADWALRGRRPLTVTGPGLLDCRLYRQPGRVIAHLLNHTNPGTWRPPVTDLYGTGPLTVSIDVPDFTPARARLLCADVELPVGPVSTGTGVGTGVVVEEVVDHEVVVFEEE